MTWYSYNLPNTTQRNRQSIQPVLLCTRPLALETDRERSGTTEETIYVGGLIEKVTLGTVISWKHYIAGGSGQVATYTRKSNGTNELHYLTRDRLGGPPDERYELRWRRGSAFVVQCIRAATQRGDVERQSDLWRLDRHHGHDAPRIHLARDARQSESHAHEWTLV